MAPFPEVMLRVRCGWQQFLKNVSWCAMILAYVVDPSDLGCTLKVSEGQGISVVVDKYKEMQERRVEFALANCCVFELESLKEKPCG